jgi:hypothetical protein
LAMISECGHSAHHFRSGETMVSAGHGRVESSGGTMKTAECMGCTLYDDSCNGVMTHQVMGIFSHLLMLALLVIRSLPLVVPGVVWSLETLSSEQCCSQSAPWGEAEAGSTELPLWHSHPVLSA